MKVDNIELIKTIYYLAWKASDVFGSGVLQDRGDQEKEKVWDCIINRNDYPGHGKQIGMSDFYADYVFGRMMKLSVKINGDVVVVGDGRDPTPDYQSWCTTYLSYMDLLKAAVDYIKVEDN